MCFLFALVRRTRHQRRGIIKQSVLAITSDTSRLALKGILAPAGALPRAPTAHLPVLGPFSYLSVWLRGFFDLYALVRRTRLQRREIIKQCVLAITSDTSKLALKGIPAAAGALPRAPTAHLPVLGPFSYLSVWLREFLTYTPWCEGKHPSDRFAFSSEKA